MSEQAKSYFFRGIVDSVLFDVGAGYVPVYFIEPDSSFHDDPHAQINHQLKDAIFRAANTRLIRIRPLDAKSSSVDEFERLVRELMRLL
ncbi:hypothetical protein [Pseudomonas viridiflava]|uniref:hypothetical protein n=1 Tax=Pseudomonas viridiflava TaxID=33069 RepID=UPI001F11EAB5|nr:hypothetical protein [Pseudomonas viridiflava]